MSNTLKLKHQLFIGKLIDKYGFDEIFEILKEAYNAIDEATEMQELIKQKKES